MTVVARKNYVGEPRDAGAKFGSNQLIYLSWDRHLLFAAPFLLCVPSEMTFRELVAGPLTTLIQPDPDAPRVDWESVRWLKANQPWQPRFDQSLAANGVGHKEQIRFVTPGLNTLCGVG